MVGGWSDGNDKKALFSKGWVLAHLLAATICNVARRHSAHLTTARNKTGMFLTNKVAKFCRWQLSTKGRCAG